LSPLPPLSPLLPSNINPWEQSTQPQLPIFIPNTQKVPTEFQTDHPIINKDVFGSSCYADFDCTGNVVTINTNPRSCLNKGGYSWKFANLGLCQNVRQKLKHPSPSHLPPHLRPILVVARTETIPTESGHIDVLEDDGDFDDSY